VDGDRRMVTLSYSIGSSPFRDSSRGTRIVSSRSRGHVLYAIVTLERSLRVSWVCTYLMKVRVIPIITLPREKWSSYFSFVRKSFLVTKKKTSKKSRHLNYKTLECYVLLNLRDLFHYGEFYETNFFKM